ncbi:MAG: ABC transporter substrate binding protein [Candidatus Erginobacter occultus]|nr:ABC transporter substrate binding protein [Candidatus Erginobacter occultus]
MRFPRLLLLTLLLLSPVFAGRAPAEAREVRIALVADGPYYYAEEYWERFRRELAVFAEDEFIFSYPEEFNLIGDYTRGRVEKNCQKALAAEEIDLVVGMGLAAANYFASGIKLPKPVILFGDLNIELLGLETDRGSSPIPNLTFQVDRGKIARDLEVIKRLARGAEVTVLIDREAAEEIPGLEELGRALSERAGVAIRYAYFAPAAEETLAGLDPDTAFIYLTPSYYFPTREAIESLLEALNRRRIPTFALEGKPVVEMGALAGLAASGIEKLARHNALKIYRILRGERPENLGVEFSGREELILNLDTARRIGYSPDFEVLLEARLLEETAEEGELITLQQAVETALENNLSYQIARRELEEAEHAYRQVLARVLPQLEALGDYQQIDSDRAQASLGLLPRWQSQVGVRFEQLIFDYSVWKSVSLARMLVAAAGRDLEIAALDTARDALLAYFGVLQSRELLRVQMENREATRNHLSTARIRMEEEAGSREQVLRLESEFKAAQASVTSAAFSLRKASLYFNQTLNRPQEAPFRLEQLDPEGDRPGSAFFAPRLDSLLANQADADRLKSFLVEAGELLSPEIALARLQVEIADEDLVRARAGIWSPTVGLQAGYSRRLGEEVWDPDPAGGGWTGSGPYPDSEEWMVAGVVSLPLWKGGGNWAEAAEKRVSVRKAGQALELQRELTALEVRSAFFDLVASSTNWDLERQRRDLARETLGIVEEKYRQGAAPLLDLLDAQSESVSAQGATVSAFYTSISDLIALQRAIGFIEYLRPAEEIEEFIRSMELFLGDNQTADQAGEV